MIYIKLTKSNKNNKLATIIIIHNYTILVFMLFLILVCFLSGTFYLAMGTSPILDGVKHHFSLFISVLPSQSTLVQTCLCLSDLCVHSIL